MLNTYFSVVIPIHNKLPHLMRSITSVLRQTYPNLELILVDDASTDGSSEKILEFKEDPRVKILRRETPGPGGYAARNLGIMEAQYEWLCFLDADDEWELKLLESLADAVEQDNSLEIISWGWIIKNGNVQKQDSFSVVNRGVKSKEYTLEDFLFGPPPVWTGAVAIKRDRLISAGMFPEKHFTRGGDMDTWVRCLWSSRKNLWLNMPMSYYYTDSVNMVTNKTERNLLFIFSPFLNELLSQPIDEQLKRAIYHYQNRYLYIMLNSQVYAGKNIDYLLLKRMNLNKQAIWLAIKLHLNRIRRVAGLI